MNRETAGVKSLGTLGYLPPTKAQILARPMTARMRPMTAHTMPKRLRAVLPGVMPHLAAKSQTAVCEVPADGDHGDDVDGQHPGVGELLLDLGEGGVGVLGEAARP